MCRKQHERRHVNLKNVHMKCFPSYSMSALSGMRRRGLWSGPEPYYGESYSSMYKLRTLC